jgi:integrase/transcriptional regulator with XRE-family HTH domain
VSSLDHDLPDGFWDAIDVLMERCAVAFSDLEAPVGVSEPGFSHLRKVDSLPKPGSRTKLTADEFINRLEGFFGVQPDVLRSRQHNLSPLLHAKGQPRRERNTRRRENARKDALSVVFSFANLIEAGVADRQRRGLAKRSIQNEVGALLGFMEHFSVADHSPLSPTMTSAFEANINSYLNFYKSINKSRDVTIKVLNSRLRRWHFEINTLVNSGANSQDLPDDFAGALKEALIRAGMTQSELARKSGIKRSIIANYATGITLPGSKTDLDVLSKIEQALSLQSGTLHDRARIVQRQIYATRRRTPHGQKLAGLSEKPYRLWTFPDRLAAEWGALFQFKTSRSVVKRAKHEKKRPGFLSRWRVRPDGSCPTADILKGYLASFFGFLVLSKDDEDQMCRGMGMEIHEISFIDLIDTELFYKFMEFRERRSHGVGSDIVRFLGQLISMTRPETGFMNRNPELFGQKDLQVWEAKCVAARDHFWDIKTELEDSGDIKLLRDPKTLLSQILSRERPMDALRELEYKMRADAPKPYQTAGSKAVYWRNLTLICMMIAHPLRRRNYIELTYRPNDPYNPGHLRQNEQGEWWLFLSSEDFKNHYGAAKKPYEVMVPRRIWPVIEEYLFNHRQNLQFADSDRVFLPDRDIPEVGKRAGQKKRTLPGFLSENSMSQIFMTVTRRYIEGCDGFGPHAFRHLIATDYLRHHPEGVVIAAAILHDSIETVLREYAHVIAQDKHRFWMAHYDERMGDD